MSPVFLLVGVALGALAVAVAVTRPRLLLTGVVVLDVTNLTGVIEQNVGISPFRPLMALAMISVFILARQGRLVLRGSPVVVALFVLLGFVWVNAVVSTDPATSAAAAFVFTNNIVYFLIVYVLLCSLRSWAEVMAAAAVGLALVAALGIVHEVLLGGEGDLFGLSRVDLVQEGTVTIPRHSGTVEDVNFWARLLLLYLPTAFSFAALAGRRGSYPRIAGWLAVAGALVGGVYLTQSRGAFLALPIALFVWVVLSGWRLRQALLWTPVILLVLIPVAWDRLSGLTQFVAGGLQSSGDLSLTNRLRLMQNAQRMFADSPWIGQGIGTYPDRVAQFDRYANTATPLEVAGAAHNFFLEQAADGGIMLLTAWLILAGAVIVVCWRSLRLLGVTEVSEVTTRYVVAGAAAGLVAWLAASLFIHLSNFRALLLVLAVLAAVEQDARRRADELSSIPPPRIHPRQAVAAVLATASAAFIVVGGLGVITTGLSPTYRSTSLITIGVEEGLGDYAAYQLDLISRGMLGPTITEILDREFEAEPPIPYQAVFQPSREGAAIVVTVLADTQDAAQAATQETAVWAEEQVAALGTPYVLRAGPTVPAPTIGTSWRRWLLLTLGVACGIFAAVLYLQGRRRANNLGSRSPRTPEGALIRTP